MKKQIRRLTLTLAFLVLTGCATVDFEYPKPETHAPTDTDNTYLGKQLAALPEKERPGQVIVAIFTDGLENASTDYDLQKISKMIKHQQKAYNWTFLFLGANQDAIATAGQMGIDRKNASEVLYSKAGISSSSASFSRKMSAMRHYSSTGEATPDYDAPMEEIVKEEEEM